MKLRRPTLRSVKGKSSKEAHLEGTESAKIEELDGLEQIDSGNQFERFDSSPSPDPQSADSFSAEDEELLASLLADPQLFRSTEWPALVGLDSLSPSMEGALLGVLSLIEPENDH